MKVGLTIGTQLASSAYVFVRGIGPLTMASGDLFGFSPIDKRFPKVIRVFYSAMDFKH